MKLSRLREIVKEELGDKGLLHFETTYTYIWNFDKTYDERLRMLKINPYDIIHAIEPTTEMQLIAVESRPNLIGKINKPAEEVQKIALNKDLFQYRYIKDVTENILRYYLQILKEKVKKDNNYEELEVFDLKQGLEELLINKDIENDLKEE